MRISKIDIDHWLGGELGNPAYRIELDAGDDTRLPEELKNAGAFAYTKIAADSISESDYLQNIGFRLVDTLVTLQRRVKNIGTDTSGVEFAVAADANDVGSLAHGAFSLTRFHLDPLIPTETANKIKENWARNFFSGKRGDYMVVAREAGHVTGFLQLLLSSNGVLTIDLVAVAANSKGNGIAEKMTTFAEQEIKGVKTLNVGTQVSNTASLRAYTKMGFRPVGAQYIWHYHQT